MLYEPANAHASSCSVEVDVPVWSRIVAEDLGLIDQGFFRIEPIERNGAGALMSPARPVWTQGSAIS
jgi:hypothetical protein